MDGTTLPFGVDLSNDVPFAFSLTALAAQLALAADLIDLMQSVP